MKELRIWLSGKDIMNLGIDFNQFKYNQIRRFFSSLGFSKIMDIWEITNENEFTGIKRGLVRIFKKSKLLKNLILIFYPSTTYFVCIK